MPPAPFAAPPSGPRRAAPHRCALGCALALGCAFAPAAFAAPGNFLPVGDPLEAELRVLDLYAPSPAAGRLALPHLHGRPLRMFEVMAAGPPVGTRGARGIAIARLERALRRDATETFASDAVPRSTPRWLQYGWPGGERVEVSAGLEGENTWTDAEGEDRSTLADGSGLQLRGSLQAGHWLAHTHLFFGQLAGVNTFSDPLVANSDFAVSTEDSWLAYDQGPAWSLQLGRSRWHWGPGEEGSMLMSKTSAPLSGMMLHMRIEALRGDAYIFNATTNAAEHEQLAAHRLEWQPHDGVRVGLAEAARYHSSGWQVLYAAGVLPYSIVQRLLDQDSADTTGDQRNNVLIAIDAAVRVADGSRLYGEVVIDDLHTESTTVPNKLGWQLGLDGAGDIRGTRVTWNAEYTRTSRYLYTSFYGREFEAQDLPIGYPTGPDAERFRARVSWDPNVDWQVSTIATRTVKGENDLDEGFFPGNPVEPAFEFEGTPETTRALEGALRWWPASGVDLSLRAGREWVTNAAHAEGVSREAWRGALAVRLTR